MNKLEKVFTDFINEGAAAAKRITEQDKKAMAYAALAQAIADSHLMIESTPLMSMSTGVLDTTKETTGKDSLKEEAGKGKNTKAKDKTKEKAETVKADVAPVEPDAAPTEPIVEIVAEIVAEISNEWTEEMKEMHKEELMTLDAYLTEWTEEYVCKECLSRYLENPDVTLEDVRPANIKGFLAYLVSISE